MVLFNPPLGTHLTVDLPAASSSSSSSIPSSSISLLKRAIITFLATDPDHTLGSEDKVELWTNAPGSTSDEGEKEWRAVRFEEVEVEVDKKVSRNDDKADESRAVSQTTALTLSIPSRTTPASRTSTSSNPHTPGPGPNKRLQATLSIPLPNPSSFDQAQSLDFEYTFRILYPDGNIWWLGGMGVNGTVCFKLGAEVGVGGEEEGKKVGWDHSGWDGFALKVDQDSFKTVILPLPSDGLADSEDVMLAYLSKNEEAEAPSSEPAFSRFSSEVDDEQVIVFSNHEQHNIITINPEKVEFDNELAEVIRLESEVGLAEAFKQGFSGGGGKKGWLSTLRVGVVPSSSISKTEGQETVVFSQEPIKDSSIIPQSKTERLLIASMFRKKGMGHAVHRVGIDLSARGFDASGSKSPRFALWQDEARKAILLPEHAGQPGDGHYIVLDLQGENVDRARVGHVDLIPMVGFGSPAGSEGPWVGLIGAVDVEEIEWVEDKEWEEVEEYEEEVDVQDHVEDAAMGTEAEPRVIPDAKGQQSKVIRRLLDHVIDDIEGGRHGGVSRDQSARATVGSMSSAASTVTDAEVQELREDMLLSPRTVDLHEVEEPGQGHHPGDETPIGKDSKEGDTGATTTVNTSEDEDEGKQVLPIGNMGSARSVSDEEPDTDDASEDGTLVNPPSSLAKSWRWLVIFFRGFWLRTLGWFRWMFGSSNITPEDKPDKKSEIVDESTPLLSKPDDDERNERDEQNDRVPEVLFAREPTPEYDIRDQETESGSQAEPEIPFEVPAPAIDTMPLELSNPQVQRMIKKTRSKTIVEPGYMRLVFAGLQGHVTLLTDMTETLKVIHRTAGSEDVTLDVSVKPAEEYGLKVLEVDTGDLKDRYELMVVVV